MKELDVVKLKSEFQEFPAETKGTIHDPQYVILGYDILHARFCARDVALHTIP